MQAVRLEMGQRASRKSASLSLGEQRTYPEAVGGRGRTSLEVVDYRVLDTVEYLWRESVRAWYSKYG